MRALVVAAAVLALGALAICAAQQVETFRDAIALHTRSVAVAERNFLPHFRLAEALRQAGRLPEAERELRSALALEPRRATLRISLADLLVRRGRVEEAIAQLRFAAAADPSRIALVRAAVRSLADDRAAAGRAGEAARLRSLAADLGGRAPQPK
jgi:predicted Zn-dependent protease